MTHESKMDSSWRRKCIWHFSIPIKSISYEKTALYKKTSIKISLEIWTENILTRKRKFQIVSCVFKWFFVFVDHQRCEVKGRTTGTTWSVTGTKGGRNETSGWGTSGGTKSLTLLRIEALIIAFGKSKLSYISCPFWMASVLVLVLVCVCVWRVVRPPQECDDTDNTIIEQSTAKPDDVVQRVATV